MLRLLFLMRLLIKFYLTISGMGSRRRRIREEEEQEYVELWVTAAAGKQFEVLCLVANGTKENKKQTDQNWAIQMTTR